MDLKFRPTAKKYFSFLLMFYGHAETDDHTQAAFVLPRALRGDEDMALLSLGETFVAVVELCAAHPNGGSCTSCAKRFFFCGQLTSPSVKLRGSMTL